MGGLTTAILGAWVVNQLRQLDAFSDFSRSPGLPDLTGRNFMGNADPVTHLVLGWGNLSHVNEE
jgi:hypothetical protein